MSSNRGKRKLEGKRTNPPARSAKGHERLREGTADAPLRTAVLLDPDAIWLTAIEQLLKRLDITVVGKTALPKRALALVAERKPDLLIVEIDTCDSEVDGIDTLRQARARAPQLTTIVLSVSNDSEQIAAAFEAGASAFMTKRTQPDDFVVAIRQLSKRSIFLADQPPSLAPNGRVSPLSRREVDVLRLVAEGNSNAEVARTIWVTEETVKFHLRNIYRKLGVANRTQASRWAHVHQLAPQNGGENRKRQPEPELRDPKITE
jgi:DNA-binding NarL/FixJ family response regulator